MENNYKKIYLCASALCLLLVSFSTFADSNLHGRADSHAPISVMGDHIHRAGEFMLSFRHMEMSMSGNLYEGENISDDELATTIVNRFSSMTGMPPTLRIVPQEMTTKMDMLGLMYAPSDKLTLMLMLNYINKEMQLKTFAGGTGTAVRGLFTTESSGLGDTKIAALVALYQSHDHKLHLNLGLSLPTGELDHRAKVLTPMTDSEGGLVFVDARLPYTMQLSSGTFDFEPGISYLGLVDNFSWGAQYKALLRGGKNDEGYSLGDQHQLQAWLQYLFIPSLSASVRLNARSLAGIDGIDSEIVGPVQTADPDNYGGQFVQAALGVNYYGREGLLKNHRLALEYGLPIIEDNNGIQMAMDYMFTFGYQYAF